MSSKRSALAQHKGQQNTSPSICNLPSSHFANGLTPVLDYEVHYVGDLAAQIAAAQIRQVDELSLIGYPTSFDEITRDVVETALRLAARGVLEA